VFTEQLAILKGGRQKAKADHLQRVEAVLRAAPHQEMSLRDMDKSHNIDRAEVEALVAQHPERFTLDTRKPDADTTLRQNRWRTTRLERAQPLPPSSR
jgi:hypothetical protein